MVEKFLKEHSHRYIATIFQITGIACWSGTASKILHTAITGEVNQLRFALFSFQLCLWLSVFGSVLIVTGWYIMYRVDRRKAELGK